MDWWECSSPTGADLSLEELLNEPTVSMRGSFYEEVMQAIRNILEEVEAEHPVESEDPLAFDELDEIREELEALQKEQDRLAEEAHLPDDAD